MKSPATGRSAALVSGQGGRVKQGLLSLRHGRAQCRPSPRTVEVRMAGHGSTGHMGNATLSWVGTAILVGIAFSPVVDRTATPAPPARAAGGPGRPLRDRRSGDPGCGCPQALRAPE